jgi:transcriptional repressor NrdR
MNCSNCNHDETRVIDSRLAGEGRSVRRRRECTACSHRFTTYEREELLPILVVKRGGQREQYDRAKMMSGLLKALHRRPVPLSEIEAFARDLETKLRDQPKREIASTSLGEAMLTFLRRADHIAYVRYASVYHDFADIDALFEAVRSLVEEPDSVDGGGRS